MRLLIFLFLLITYSVFADKAPENQLTEYDILLKVKPGLDSRQVIYTCVVPQSIAKRQKVSIHYSLKPKRTYVDVDTKYAEWVFPVLKKELTIKVKVKAVLYKYDHSTIRKNNKITLSARKRQKYLAQEKWLESKHDLIKKEAAKIKEKSAVAICRHVCKLMNHEAYNPANRGALKLSCLI